MNFSMAKELPGRLIAVEGLDGSGKSTQLYLLKRWFELRGPEVLSLQSAPVAGDISQDRRRENWEMAATIHQDASGIWLLNISGVLRKEDMDAVQERFLHGLTPQTQARLLVLIAADFSGWVGKEVWGDMTFFVRHGNLIAKIAIVGDPRWEDGMLMFAGAGFRRAPVKYFPTDQLAEAEVWLI